MEAVHVAVGLFEPARALGEAAARRAQSFAWPLIARQLEELIFAVSGRVAR